MHDVSTFRLYLMRAAYALVFVGLSLEVWPAFFGRAAQMEHMHGVVCAVLTAVSLLAAVGLRHPLRMLPLLLFELTWKTLWLLVVALPLWQAGRLEGDFAATTFANLMGLVVFPIAIPWRYVFANYVKGRGDRWGRAPRVPNDTH